MQDFDTEPMPCPYCGLPSDVQTNVVDGTPPEPGALLVCILCACPAFLREDGKLHRLTTEELTEVYENRHVMTAILSVIAASRCADVGDPTPMLRFVPRTQAGIEIERRDRMSPSHKFSPWARGPNPMPDLVTLLHRPSIDSVLVEHENGVGTQYRKLQDG